MSQGIQPLSDPELVAGPELVRVSVLGGNTQFDVGLPAGVQIAALIPELLSHIRSRSSGHAGSASGVDDDDHDGTAFRPHLWTLSMIGGEDLPAEVTLSESGVRDGELLVLQSRKSGAAPPLFDDVIDAVARLGEERTSQWSATTARYAGYAAAVAFSLLTALALLVGVQLGTLAALRCAPPGSERRRRRGSSRRGHLDRAAVHHAAAGDGGRDARRSGCDRPRRHRSGLRGGAGRRGDLLSGDRRRGTVP